MKTIKNLLVLLAITAVQFTKAQGGEIRGLIKDNELNPVIGALVKITQGGYLLGGTTTDVNGKYVYKPLDAGEYEIIVTSPLHSTCRLTKVPVSPNEATYADIKMKLNTLDVVEVIVEFEAPLVDATMIDIISINAEEWNQSVMRTEGVVEAINNSYSGAVSDSEGQWHIHGARADATEYLVDGVKVSSVNGLPNLSIENVSLISGGIPAMYGDLTSGVIVVTTKDYFSGMRYKRMRDTEFAERQEYKRKQRIEKLEEESRLKEIEQEKLNDKTGK
jgi:hypothetical protein